MSIELPIDGTYEQQYERICEEADDDFKQALARLVEQQIHANYQEVVLNGDSNQS